MMKLKFLATAILASLVVQKTQAISFNEPLLIEPFAQKINLAKSCEEQIVNEVLKATKAHEDDFPGGIFGAQAYRIRARGLLYKGSDVVFEATRVLSQGMVGSRYAKVRGDLLISKNQCQVGNIRITQIFNRREVE